MDKFKGVNLKAWLKVQHYKKIDLLSKYIFSINHKTFLFIIAAFSCFSTTFFLMSEWS